MIDTSNAKWDLSKEEKYAIKWFNDNGFSGGLDKQYVSKSIFIVAKDGTEDRFELPQGTIIKNISMYMDSYGRSFEMKKKLTANNEGV